jgi:hypothetical protein
VDRILVGIVSNHPRIGIDIDELKICIAEGRIGSALLARFREPENTTDIAT